MKTTKKLSLALASALLLSVSACSKYEDGSFSLQSKTARLVNTWTYDKVTTDGKEETLSADEKATTIEFKKDNTFEVKAVSGGQTYTVKGKWEFVSDKEKVKVTPDGGSASDATELTITRLKSDEFWYKETDGSSTSEVHLKSK